MSKYYVDIYEFLQGTGTTLEIGKKTVAVNPLWGEKTPRNCYDCVLYNDKLRYEFKYWDTLYNTEHNRSPIFYDVLSCLTTYPTGNYIDWCADFGYDLNNSRAQVMYDLCAKEYEVLCKLFTEQELKNLEELLF